tara:strand:- start:467 stop:1174 length:708 start_codon:yes stop_codon:yes gene_type:complete
MQGLSQTFKIKTFEVGPMQNLIYLVWDIETNKTAIIDPAWDLTKVHSFIKNNNLILEKILLTHSHHDHVNAIDKILINHDVQIHINKKEKLFWGKIYDNFFTNDGDDLINLGKTQIRSMHTPGHTPGSACYLIGSNLIAGDTLFVFGCGRCDLHGGSPEEMYNTLKNLKFHLNEETLILPGHNYSTKKTSTLREQIEGNPFFHFNDLKKFINYRMDIHDKARETPYAFHEKKHSH